MTETVDRKASHRRSLKVTTIATLGGVAAALASQAISVPAGSRNSLLVVFALVVVELGLMRAFGVDVGEFSAKDHLYIAFMTFAMWFVAWGVLLTEGIAF
ncbi:hypothetical protein [Halobacterium zhouii]|uniref:EMC6-like membrane protein n=1 Tax=Halobacterium zhouii TaxID=2902624 RepID=UPI001E37420D|nr:hypothetical protein [Halobacterium zhouii]